MRLPRLVRIAADTVEATRRSLPADVREAAAGVAVLFEPEPGPDVLSDGFEPDILGLFSGSPHGAGLSEDNPSPPRIFLYIKSLWDYAGEDAAEFREEVRLTYLHELGHYLGWDEDQVAARGLD
jgi:predicted Zn-dependent protease with MMP-like domain